MIIYLFQLENIMILSIKPPIYIFSSVLLNHVSLKLIKQELPNVLFLNWSP